MIWILHSQKTEVPEKVNLMPKSGVRFDLKIPPVVYDPFLDLCFAVIKTK